MCVAATHHTDADRSQRLKEAQSEADKEIDEHKERKKRELAEYEKEVRPRAAPR